MYIHSNKAKEILARHGIRVTRDTTWVDIVMFIAVMIFCAWVLYYLITDYIAFKQMIKDVPILR